MFDREVRVEMAFGGRKVAELESELAAKESLFAALPAQLAAETQRASVLEAEVTRLNQWVTYLNGNDAMKVAADVESWRQEIASLVAQADTAKRDAATARAAESSARSDLVEDHETASLQDAGFYTFNHPLDDAVAYKEALTKLQGEMKACIREGRAVDSVTTWTVNGSAVEGRRMVKDTSTLMLRAYNAEADSLVRALRPQNLASVKTRLDKTVAAIARLGRSMQIRITPEYHAMRFKELELTSDDLVRKQQEKETERDNRERLRDQARAAAEMAAKLEQLRKERDHYSNVVAKLHASGDTDAAAEHQAKLDEIESAMTGVEQRAANIRTGHVYVISNVGAFGPDMVKIGMTRRLEPMDRVIELGDASVPFRFDVHAMVFSEDAVSLETKLHQAFADRRVNRINPRREFFYASPAEVREVFANVDGALLLEYKEASDALEWHASGAVSHSTQPPAAQQDEAYDVLKDASAAPDPSTESDPKPAIAGEDGLVADLDADLNDDAVDLDTEVDTLGDTPSEPELVATTTHSVEPQPQLGEPPAQEARPTPVPGAWLVDPHDPTLWRWWDGQQWTQNTSPR